MKGPLLAGWPVMGAWSSLSERVVAQGPDGQALCLPGQPLQLREGHRASASLIKPLS